MKPGRQRASPARPGVRWQPYPPSDKVDGWLGEPARNPVQRHRPSGLKLPATRMAPQRPILPFMVWTGGLGSPCRARGPATRLTAERDQDTAQRGQRSSRTLPPDGKDAPPQIQSPREGSATRSSIPESGAVPVPADTPANLESSGDIVGCVFMASSSGPQIPSESSRRVAWHPFSYAEADSK